MSERLQANRWLVAWLVVLIGIVGAVLAIYPSSGESDVPVDGTPTPRPQALMATPVPKMPAPTADVKTPPVPKENQLLPAFPGAEGYGKWSRGGRGGQVFVVDTLSDWVNPDDGVTSLRECVFATGPRICVFAVAGTIELRDRLRIGPDASNPEPWAYLTIAGQSAPGDGITLKNGPQVMGATIVIDTHDVVISGIRVRSGIGGTGVAGANGDLVDGINLANHGRVYNVMLDHLSVSWTVDEAVDFWQGTQAATLQWSIISEPLNRSTHSYTLADPNIGHSKAISIGDVDTGNISIHHNLIAHSWDRFPETKPGMGVVDIVNNTIYNWGGRGVPDSKEYVTLFSGQYAEPVVNHVGNVYKAGPSSIGERERMMFYRQEMHPFRILHIYLSDNLDLDRGPLADVVVLRPSIQQVEYASRPYGAFEISVQPALNAHESVLALAGAAWRRGCEGGWELRRDVVDVRVVNDVRNRTGMIIDSPEQVGGWPELAGGSPCPDRDRDGMPDAWELLHGLNPELDDSAGDIDGDGYTNVEAYLFGIGE